MTPFAAGAIVAAVRPGGDPLVALTAADLARLGGGALYFAYVDEQRFVERIGSRRGERGGRHRARHRHGRLHPYLCGLLRDRRLQA